MSIEYKIIPISVVLRVKCPKLDGIVDVDLHCKKCRFFFGMTFHNESVCCQYESDKL
jgi:hypothetical protein